MAAATPWVALAVLLVACTPVQAPVEMPAQMPPEYVVAETEASFSGWLGERAVLAYEELLETGDVRESWHGVGAFGSTNIVWGENAERSKLAEGSRWIADFGADPGAPLIELTMDVDEAVLIALEEAARNWLPGDKHPDGIDTVLQIVLTPHDGGPERPIWTQDHRIHALWTGEGLDVERPRLLAAWASPTAQTLLVRLTGFADEFVVVPLAGAP